MLTAIAAVVFFASKFTEGAWLLLIIIPVLVLTFARIERYYQDTGRQLGLGERPDRPRPLVAGAANSSLVIVPVAAVSRMALAALQAAGGLGGQVIAVAVRLDADATAAMCREWEAWNPGVELKVLPSPHRNLVAPIVGFVEAQLSAGRQVTVLLSEVEPRKRRYQMLHNQRGLVLAAALRSRTDAIVATLPFRLT